MKAIRRDGKNQRDRLEHRRDTAPLLRRKWVDGQLLLFRDCSRDRGLGAFGAGLSQEDAASPFGAALARAPASPVRREEHFHELPPAPLRSMPRGGVSQRMQRGQQAGPARCERGPRRGDVGLPGRQRIHGCVLAGH